VSFFYPRFSPHFDSFVKCGYGITASPFVIVQTVSQLILFVHFYVVQRMLLFNLLLQCNCEPISATPSALNSAKGSPEMAREMGTKEIFSRCYYRQFCSSAPAMAVEAGSISIFLHNLIATSSHLLAIYYNYWRRHRCSLAFSTPLVEGASWGSIKNPGGGAMARVGMTE